MVFNVNDAIHILIGQNLHLGVSNLRQQVSITRISDLDQIGLHSNDRPVLHLGKLYERLQSFHLLVLLHLIVQQVPLFLLTRVHDDIYALKGM